MSHTDRLKRMQLLKDADAAQRRLVRIVRSQGLLLQLAAEGVPQTTTVAEIDEVEEVLNQTFDEAREELKEPMNKLRSAIAELAALQGHGDV